MSDDKWCPENDAAYRAEIAAMNRHTPTEQLHKARARIAELEAALADGSFYKESDIDKLQSDNATLRVQLDATLKDRAQVLARAEAAEAEVALLRDYYNAAEAIEKINAEWKQRKLTGLLDGPNIFNLTDAIGEAGRRLSAARAALAVKSRPRPRTETSGEPLTPA